MTTSSLSLYTLLQGGFMYTVGTEPVDGTPEKVLSWKIREHPLTVAEVVEAARREFPGTHESELHLSVNHLFTEPTIELRDPL
ncbi:MAG: hypothetical protein KW788_00185 [Candidatus Doudnabacteria bacterium]|nr:hypothetical protein [Candidatus Doudnabacteria bacterium]